MKRQYLQDLVAWIDAIGVVKFPALAGMTTAPLDAARVALKERSGPLYVELAGLVQASLNCLRPDANDTQREWAPRHIARAVALVREYMPSGSGFDNGTMLDTVLSHGNCLAFRSSYHAMHEGTYTHWIDFQIIVRPDLQFGIRCELRMSSAKDNEDHGDYIAETFQAALMADIDIEAFYTQKGL